VPSSYCQAPVPGAGSIAALWRPLSGVRRVGAWVRLGKGTLGWWIRTTTGQGHQTLISESVELVLYVWIGV
jgi:hypothetical protein